MRRPTAGTTGEVTASAEDPAVAWVVAASEGLLQEASARQATVAIRSARRPEIERNFFGGLIFGPGHLRTRRPASSCPPPTTFPSVPEACTENPMRRALGWTFALAIA